MKGMKAAGRRIALSVSFLSSAAFLRAEDVLSVSTEPAASPAYVVMFPLSDLRRDPAAVDGAAALKRPYDSDPLQETQLLFGEKVLLKEERGSWARVEAVEQPEFTHHDQWEGYPGWALKSHLAPEPAGYAPNAVVAARYASLHAEPSRKAALMELPLGARVQVTFQRESWARVRRPEGGDGWMQRKDLRGFSEMPAGDERRAAVLKAARLFLGEPYYWGGRAGHRESDVDRPSGLDCSALVHLAYRTAGVDVPRDSHEQYMASQPLPSSSDLRPGDLVFLAKTGDPNRIVHVMLYAGGDAFLEAVQEFNAVREVTMKEKLGRPLKELKVMDPAGGRFAYFGRLLPD